VIQKNRAQRPQPSRSKVCHPHTKRKEKLSACKRACALVLPMHCLIWERYQVLKERISTPAITAGKKDVFLRWKSKSVRVETHYLVFVFLLTKRGIAWAPICGKAISELVLDGECTSVNLNPFDPARFTPDAGRGGRGRKRGGESVGEQW
jgi:hypothetical protein